MMVYFIEKIWNNNRMKTKYQTPVGTVCLELPDDLLEICSPLMIYSTDVFVDAKVGISVCNPKDVFDIGYARRLARKRLVPCRFHVEMMRGDNDTCDMWLNGINLPFFRWMYSVKVRFDKESKKYSLEEVNYNEESLGDIGKKCLAYPEYKKALMECAIEQVLRGDHDDST